MKYDITRLKGYESFKSINKIEKGWSLDVKYHVVECDGQEYMYRLSGLNKLEDKKQEFEVVKAIYQTGIPMSKPIEFVIVKDQYCYSKLTYIKGEQAEVILPDLSVETQYKIGFEAGKILQKIHSVSIQENNLEWSDSMKKKIEKRIDQFKKCGIANSKVDGMIEYVRNHDYLLTEFIVCQNHGDYHTNNMILDESLDLHIIDFNRHSIDHRFYEFNRISTSLLSSIHFSRGQIDGYFDNDIPKDFFKYLKFYSCSNLIGTIVWCLEFSDGDISFALKSIDKVFENYDGLKLDIPKWYEER